MKLRVYIDSSVVGGYFDEEFEDDTKLFFDRIFKKDFLVHFSEISETELSLAGKTGHIDHPSPFLMDHASPAGKTTP